jgi:hypothetical protein
MADESRLPDKQETLELILDHVYESRHELVTEMAYKLWEQRGCPVGSPNVDWFEAEQAVYASLVASGLITVSQDDPRNMREEIYQPDAQ